MKKAIAILIVAGLPLPAAAFQYNMGSVDLSLPARTERGKAVPPKQPLYDSPAMRDWMKFGCLWNSPSARNAGAPAETCIHQVAAELPPFDPAKPRHFGEHYSPRLFLECKLHAHEVRGQGQFSPAQCEKFRLRRIENPTFWPYEHNKDFKWPEAPKESVYRPGMTPEAYHKALCEKESGQWEYKRVEGVKSIYLVRPYRTTLDQDYQRDRFVEEGSYLVSGYWALNPENLLPRFAAIEKMFERRRSLGRQSEDTGQRSVGSRLESNKGEPDPFNPRVEDYFLGALTTDMRAEDGGARPSKTPRTPYFLSATSAVSSQIGIVWRDIERERDRELYVGGLEVAVVDLKTNDVLGHYRTFVSMGRAWASARRCSTPTTGTGSSLFDFIVNAIKP